MASNTRRRKVRRSFALRPEAIAFLYDVRRRLKARSASEALDRLIHEAMVARKCKELDEAIETYYDKASDEELNEQEIWSRGTSAGMCAGLAE